MTDQFMAGMGLGVFISTIDLLETGGAAVILPVLGLALLALSFFAPNSDHKKRRRK